MMDKHTSKGTFNNIYSIRFYLIMKMKEGRICLEMITTTKDIIMDTIKDTTKDIITDTIRDTTTGLIKGTTMDTIMDITMDPIKDTTTKRTATRRITAKKITAIMVVVIVTEIHGYIECNKDTITTETKKIVR
ncbi:hypothetical protein [Ectobacillus funiculus]